MTENNQSLSKLLAPISVGELIDKITILEIKKENMLGNKQKNVIKELTALKLIIEEKELEIDTDLYNLLKEINKRLWDIEDRIRLKESKQSFDKEFITLARSVYKENDKRASIKKEINSKYNSDLIEEKSYIEYQKINNNI